MSPATLIPLPSPPVNKVIKPGKAPPGLKISIIMNPKERPTPIEIKLGFNTLNKFIKMRISLSLKVTFVLFSCLSITIRSF